LHNSLLRLREFAAAELAAGNPSQSVQSALEAPETERARLAVAACETLLEFAK